MITTLSIIIILGLSANHLFVKLKLPGLLGMLILGVLIGPYVLNLIDPETLRISSDLRRIALIIILLRAGLGVSRTSLNRVGLTAVKLGFIPGVIEGFSIALASMIILDFSFIEGGILGFVVAAVSPAVVVPKMLDYIKKGLGINKGIPTLILAGSSIDDVLAITIFSIFLGLYSGSHVNIGITVISIPISILSGVLLGLITGIILVKIFGKYHIRDTKKVLIILGFALLLSAVENYLKSRIEIASLLGVMTIGFIILEYKPKVAGRLAIKFDKIWIFAEIILFVLIGSQVNISVALDAGLKGLAIIGVGIVARSIGVIISTLKTDLNMKERLFCNVSYLPKATVQAAIGAIPLSMGVPSGDVILAIAVLSILITAPVGSILINLTATKFLSAK